MTKKEFIGNVKKLHLMKTFMFTIHALANRSYGGAKTVEEVIDKIVENGRYNSENSLLLWLNDWKRYINNEINSHKYTTHHTIFCDELIL